MDVHSRRLAAIVFTDICGYSALSHRDEALALALLSEHRDLVRPLVAKFGGREIKTIGDAFFLEFASAVDAVDCAIAIQEALRDRNRSAPRVRRILMRIGIHLGDVAVTDGGADLHGDGVNIAARLQFLAPQGGICLSGSVYEQVHSRVSYPVVRMGSQALKNIRRPVKIYRVDILGSAPTTLASLALRGGRLRIPLHDWRVALSAAAVLGLLASPLFTNFSLSRPGANPIESRRRIAVMPFTIAQDPSSRRSPAASESIVYIAEGLTDELTSGLSRNSRLRVLARASVASYQRSGKSIHKIGDELSVANVVSGQVRRIDGKIRIQVSLSDTASDENLWSDTFETSSDGAPGLYDIQRKIVAQVLAQFTSRTPASLPPSSGSAQAPQSAAYLHYIKGRYFLNRRTEESFRKAAEMFEASIQADSRFAPALSGLADTYGLMGFYGYLSPREALSQSAQRASAAFALDPASAEVLTHRAIQRLYYDHDWAGAEEDFRSAIESWPGYATAHQWYGEMLTARGDYARAREAFQRASAIDPLSLIVTSTSALPDYYGRHPHQALRQIRSALDMDEGFATAQLFLGKALLQANDRKGAIAALKQAVKASGGAVMMRAALATAYAADERREDARAILRELELLSRERYVSPYDLAAIHAWLGERESALQAIERAYRERSFGLVWMGVDPLMDPLRRQPRFARIQALVRGTSPR